MTTEPTLDRTDPAGAIAAAAARVSNWGRWGADDVRGTMNFLTDDMRRDAAQLIRTGQSFSLAQRFDMDGPQKGWRRRTNPVHTMLDTGTDAVTGVQGFPHGLGGADDVIAMPLQCSTQWDGLGHIFDHGKAWNGRPAEQVVTSLGDLVTGIETVADVIVGRGVLLDVGRVYGDEHGELPDGFAITEAHIRGTIAAQGETSIVGTGDIVVVRTGQYARTRRLGWGDYAGGAAPGLSSRPPIGCTIPRSPPSPPTPGASRFAPTNSTWRSSRCIRWRFRRSASSSARCGLRMSLHQRALQTATTTSS